MTTTDATNLAAAINRNLSGTALDRIVAVASGSTVTVYALTPGSRVVLTDAKTVTNFSWSAVTAGTNGAQANIVAFNQLYSGTAPVPFCGPTHNFTEPEFIFSYASGVGPVATSPNISLNGTEILYVENDPNIGAILHVLTYASGSTEYGAACGASNNGTTQPTCATSPVIPGSTADSMATDFMLPLGSVPGNVKGGVATAAAGAADSVSSPFTNYFTDTTYVGDNNGNLYAITPTYFATPAYKGGNFPVSLIAAPASATVTGVTATAGTPGVVTITVNNTLAALQSVVISGVVANVPNACTQADVDAINGAQIVFTATGGTAITTDVNIPSATTGGGCTVPTNAIATPGTAVLSAPTVDVGGTGNVFVGDASGNLYMLTSAGVEKTTLALGENINGGIRSGPIVDTANSVGYTVMACTTGTVGEAMATNAALVQFDFTATAMTMGGEAGKAAGLDTNENENCTAAGYAMYDPTPDERYFDVGISSATAANNGEIIAAASGSAGQQIKPFQFISSVMQTTPEAKPQLAGTNHSVLSPLTHFWDTTTFASSITALSATAAVVTVTAANSLAANDIVMISGVAASGSCTAGDVTAINSEQTVIAAGLSATQFEFDATIPSPTSGCTLTGATATGGPDYMFMGAVQNPTELYSFLLPSGAIAGTSTATNTTDVASGTSGMIVDNELTDGQASSLYYGTLATSTGICGTTVYCAIKVTQSALQ